MAYKDIDVRKAHDRERFRKRTAARRALGLCPRCGDRPPAPGLTLCDPCGEKRRASERARDARRRAAGVKRRRNPASDRKRSRRQAAERVARGLCARCGKTPPEPDRRLCEPCAEKRRAAERARYAAGKAAGKPYGGRDPEARCRAARAVSRKRNAVRSAAGLCTRCGRRPPAEGRTACEPCREACREAGRELYDSRRTAGLCVACNRPAFEGHARCGVCAAVDGERRDKTRKNEAARRRYSDRRARGRCTDCNAPSQGAARCDVCSKRSYEKSDYFRGIPVWDPVYTVIERATGVCHGPFDTEAEAAAGLVFAKLSYDQVEIVSDAPVTASFTGRA